MSSHIMSSVARRSFALVSGLRQSVRRFSTPAEAAKPAAPGSSSASARPNAATHKVDSLERKMLVWTGKYKSAEEVPAYVGQEVMEKARNRIRIRLANIMMVLTAIGCVFVIISGKKAAERGETVQKQNLDWHKEYNQKSTEEAIAAQKK